MTGHHIHLYNLLMETLCCQPAPLLRRQPPLSPEHPVTPVPAGELSPALYWMQGTHAGEHKRMSKS